jgi:hypothetical protein
VPFGRPLVATKTEREKKDKNKNQGTEKDAMLGNYRAYFQRRLMRIPRMFKVALWQHKRYRYEKNSDRPMKEDDHHPDATMLMLRRWPLGKRVSRLVEDGTPAPGKSTVTGGLMDEVF